MNRGPQSRSVRTADAALQPAPLSDGTQYLKDDAEDEDAVQDAYLRAYQGIAKFRGEAKLSTWLTRIVINEAIEK